MRKEYKFWLTSLGVSVVVHLLLLTTAAFAFGNLLSQEPKELKPIEVEIAEIAPLKQIEEPPEPLKQDSEPLPLPERAQIKEPPRPAKSPVKPDNKPLPNISEPMVQAADSSTALPAKVGTISPIVGDTGSGFKGEPSPGISDNPAGTSGGSSKGKGQGRADKRATPSYAPSPNYPTDARTEKLEGTVRVRVEIDEKGRVLNASISAGSGSVSLDQAALSCARKWRFSPAYRDGRPVADSAIIPIVFDLKKK